jgi:hypothetical protein
MLIRHQGHIAARRIMSMEKSSDTIGNQKSDLPVCSVVPQPAALPLALCTLCGVGNLKCEISLIDDKIFELKSFFSHKAFHLP